MREERRGKKRREGREWQEKEKREEEQENTHTRTHTHTTPVILPPPIHKEGSHATAPTCYKHDWHVTLYRHNITMATIANTEAT